MAKICITGSTDGLGFLAAQSLIQEGHQLYLHARNQNRADELLKKLPEAEHIFIADLANVKAVHRLAEELNSTAHFDSIIHNAGVLNATGLDLWKINVVAPYLLTALVKMPKRMIYLSSSMHKGGRSLTEQTDLNTLSYSDSKLLLTTFMKVVADKHPSFYINAVDPGWVPTKMGGPQATDDLTKGFQTQAWLATSEDVAAKVNGKYFFQKEIQTPHPDVNNKDKQQILLNKCAEFTDLSF